jgi:tetratricopeptide (TPR) repeat protein
MSFVFLKYIISPVIRAVLSLTNWGKSQLEKDFKFYAIAKKIGIANQRDDFNYCYLETLYRLIELRRKDKEVIRLFAIKEIEDSFKLEIYQKNAFAFQISLDDNLHTNPLLKGLKNKSVDLNAEIVEFKKEFEEVIQETRKPKEIEVVSKLDQLLELHQADSAKLLKPSFIEDLEFPTGLMNSNNHQQALLFLEAFKKSKWEKVDSELKYKVLANIGICKLNLNREQEAGEYLTKAVEYNPDNSKALGFAALGFSLLNEDNKAREFAEKSISKDPGNTNAWIALFESIKSKEEFEITIKRIPNIIAKNSAISYSLFKQYKSYGEFDSAEQVLRDSLQGTDRDPQILAALGTLLLEEIKDPLLLKTQQLGEQLQNKVKEGIAFLTEAIGKIKGKDLEKYRWWWFVNRGIAKKFINDNQGALEDIKQAYELNPNEYFTIRHLAISLTENNNHSEAKSYFEKLKELDSKDELIDVAICECLIQTGNKNQAEEKLTLLSENANDSRIRQEATSLLIKLKSRNDKIAEAIELGNKEIAKDDTNIFAYLDLFFVLVENKDIDGARQNLYKAYTLVTEDTENRIVFELAERFFQINEFEKAGELYSRIADDSLFTPLNQKLLHSYVNSGDLGKTLELSKKIIEKNGLLPEVVEIQSYVYENLGELNSAIRICEECLTTNPNSYPIIARLSNLFFRVGDKTKLGNTLSLIEDYSKFPIHLQFRLSFLNGWIGKTELAMEIAYKARRDDYSNGETHLNFIQLGLQLKPDWSKLLNFETVVPDSTVTVIDEAGNSIAFTILKYKSIHSERGERNIDDKLSQAMLGKKVGERFDIEQDFGKPRSYTITNILHKFSYANRESYELLGTKFITTKGITVFDLKKDTKDSLEKLKPITDILDEGYSFDEQLYGFYKSGSLPIGSIASFRKQNPIEVWGWLMSKEFGIISAAAINNEYLLSTSKLYASKRLLLDITSLLTLSELNLLDDIVPSTILFEVSSSTVDVLREEINKCESSSENGFISIGKHNGRYFRNEVTKEAIEKNVNYLKGILVWVEKNCKILPCNRILTIPEKDREHFYRLFGESFYETALIAEDTSAIVLSDDGVYRSYIFQEHKINGISSSAFLYYLYVNGKLSFEKFNRAMTRLYIFRYTGLYINAEILWLCFEESKFTLNRPFETVLPML